MAKLSVSGKIFSELSDNVPSSKFAIIELIKNSYEAVSEEIRSTFVQIDINDTQLTIEDDGIGMNEADVQDLLILTHSNKKYGAKINDRIISGEKGIGFFSCFKFGDKVKVETIREGNIITFELDKKKIMDLKSIDDYEVNLNISQSIDKNKHGTKITISDLNNEIMNLFKSDLEKPEVYLKLTNVINDENNNFNININRHWIKGNHITYDSTVYDKNLDAQFVFDSKKHYIKDKNKYYFKMIDSKGKNNKDIDIDKEYNEFLSKVNTKFNIKVLSLTNSSIGKGTSPLHQINNGDKVVPLIYFNNSLFDNYSYYRPDIVAKKANGLAIRQQAGYINFLISEQNIINFNSDRTAITESKLAKKLQKFLDKIAEQIAYSTKGLREQRKNEEPKHLTKKIIINSTLAGNSIADEGISKIFYGSTKVNTFDSSKIGVWKLEYDNGDEIDIEVVDYPDPQINVINSKLLLNKKYDISDIVEGKDYNGGYKFKPKKLEISPIAGVSQDTVNDTLTFMIPGTYILKVSIEDKVSKKSSSSEINLYVVDNTNTINHRKPEPVIRPLISCINSIEPDLNNFVMEINDLYSQKDKFSNVIAASIRTLLELVLDDIYVSLSVSKDKSIEDNFKMLINKNHIDNIIDNITDDKDKYALKTFYRENKGYMQTAKTVERLQYSTHGAKRIWNLDSIISEIPYINFMLTILMFTTINKKE